MYVICHGQGGYDERDIQSFPDWDFDPGSRPDSAGDFRDGATRWCIALAVSHCPLILARPLPTYTVDVPSHRGNLMLTAFLFVISGLCLIVWNSWIFRLLN